MLSIKKLIVLSFIIVWSQQIDAQQLKSLEGQEFSEEVQNSVLYSTKGEKTSLAAVLENLKGKIVFVDFWASWCKSCAAEAEYTKKIQDDYKDKEISFLFLSTDTDYKQWLRGLSVINLDGNHYRIEPESKKAIQNYLKIKGIPYFVLLDKEGKIYDSKAPWPHLQKMRDEIDRLISISN